MIRLQDIWRSYQLGDEVVHALAGVDEHIEPGEHVAIMGPSGSGKSTLLNIVGCLDRPTRGSYRLAGREVSGLDDTELSAARRDTIGYVFQSYHLVPRLSARDNVALPLVFAGVPPRERVARADAALASVGLSDRAGHRPSELSGGQRQRVAIARATILRPKLLLADEPTGNLDGTSGAQILELLEQLHADGLTLVVVTHDPEVARRAQRVLLLRDGQVARRMAGSDLRTMAEALAAVPHGTQLDDGPAAPAPVPSATSADADTASDDADTPSEVADTPSAGADTASDDADTASDDADTASEGADTARADADTPSDDAASDGAGAPPRDAVPPDGLDDEFVILDDDEPLP